MSIKTALLIQETVPLGKNQGQMKLYNLKYSKSYTENVQITQ